ncbi:MAG TPA: ParB/RepB/Spo0J family partition protein [Kiritimatiellia bacterium]|nr:ParB/RepB/Spo0J family partition protein [Kiritimatiellia bacterium]
MAGRHIGLGRGLGALIKDTPAAPAEAAAESAAGAIQVPIEKVHKSPWQPRKRMAAEPLEELTHSVRERGVLQPLLVRKVEDRFELIAGERRLRASQAAGLKEVPVIIMDVSDREALELALVENLQREDLNLIEEAEGYRALGEKFEMTQEQIAQRVGKARASVANALRLLDLPNRVKQLVAENQLSAGHAKVLLGLEIGQEQELLAARVVGEGLSVRALEHVINRLKKPAKKARSEKSDIPEGHLKYLTDKLHQHMGTAVRISPSRTLANGKKVKGTVEIDFYSNDDLDRLLVILGLVDNI